MTANRPTPQTVQQSMGIIVSGVHKRAFLSKLAQFGHVPETEAEADSLVSLGFKLASLDPSIQEPNPFVAPAPQPRGKYASAAQALDEVLGTSQQGETDHLYKVASQLAQDPAIYGAALTINQAAALANAGG